MSWKQRRAAHDTCTRILSAVEQYNVYSNTDINKLWVECPQVQDLEEFALVEIAGCVAATVESSQRSRGQPQGQSSQLSPSKCKLLF